MTWEKMVIPVCFFFISNWLKQWKFSVVAPVTGLAMKPNSSMITTKNADINNIIHWYTNMCETKHTIISLNTYNLHYRNITYVPSCRMVRQTVRENLHSAIWATLHSAAQRSGLGACLCSSPWPRLLPWSREIWPWEVQWWEQRKHQKLHIPAIWIWPKKLHW